MQTEDVRVDGGLIEAARTEGRVAGRSVSAQITHWARLGRAFENARIPGSAIGSVLAKQGDFDSLSDEDQRAVSAMWEIEFAERIADLDLVAEFEASGEAYAFLDDDGNVVVVQAGEPGESADSCSPPE